MNAPDAAALAAGAGGQVPGPGSWPGPGTANRGEWRARAACAGLATSLFYTERSGSASDALRVCTACPVREECLADALAAERLVSIQEIFGVRGGMSAVARRRLLAGERTKTVRATVAVCGTDSGYYRHRRNRESPCDACKAAHAAAFARRDRPSRAKLRAVS